MAKRGEFFDYDPITGLEERYEETPDGKIHIHTYQDVEPHLNWAKAVANEGTADDAWNKTGWTMYASLPLIVVGKMMKDGINVFDQNDIGRVVTEVNRTYPAFKTTHKHHEVR